MDRTRPNGKVIGIDLIPAQPPKGVATFQGDFLSPKVQAMVKEFISKYVALSGQTSPSTGPEHADPATTDHPSYTDIGLHASQPVSDQGAMPQLVDVSFTLMAGLLINPSNINF